MQKTQKPQGARESQQSHLMRTERVTQTVSEAKYTYWRSIIDIAAASGLSREEFCWKYKISLKTFRHFEGIFKRQEARGYVYHRKEEAKEGTGGQISGNDENDRTGMAGHSDVSVPDGQDVQVLSGKGLGKPKKAEGQGKPERIAGSRNTRNTDGRSRYVEIPMVEDEAGNDIHTVDTDDIGKQDSPEDQESLKSPDGMERAENLETVADNPADIPRRSVELNVGGCRIAIGEDVDEATLISILKAVSANA